MDILQTVTQSQRSLSTRRPYRSRWSRSLRKHSPSGTSSARRWPARHDQQE